jgi:ORF6N domain
MGRAMNSTDLAKIEKMIFIIREQKVMLDTDLAELYEVKTKDLNRAVKRNIMRFPDDFMFQLTLEEHDSLRFQFGTLETGRGKYRKYLPFVFTEQGVAMLSGVLNSPRAINVNIAIMRIFVKLRQFLIQESLSERVRELEKGTDKLFRIVFQRLDDLDHKTPALPPKRRKIGI